MPLPFRMFEDNPGKLELKFQAPYAAWKADPTPDKADKLLGIVQPIIDKAVRQFAGQQASPVVASRAKSMALDAIGTYDPARAQLNTHLISQLRGLQRYSAQTGRVVSVPERVILDWKRLKDAEEKIRIEEGREPSDAELADLTNLPLKRMAYVRKMRPSISEGSYTPTRDQTSEDEELYSPAVRDSSGDTAWLDFVYNDLNDTDKVILEYSLGLHGRPTLTNQQIAAKLGISPPAVSQRRAKIQAMIDQRDDLGLF